MTTRGAVPVANNDRQRHLEKTFKKGKAKQHRSHFYNGNSVEKDLIARNDKASIFPRRNQNSQHCGL